MAEVMSAWDVVQQTLSRLKVQEAAVEDAKKVLRNEERELTSRRNAFEAARAKFYKEHPEMIPTVPGGHIPEMDR